MKQMTFGSLVAVLVIGACGGEPQSPSERASTREDAAVGPDRVPGNDGGTVDGEDKPPDRKEEAGWRDAYNRCDTPSPGTCVPWEDCVLLGDTGYAVCASPCSAVADCVDLSARPVPEFDGSVACILFQGAKRCFLECKDPSQCKPGMDCREGVCVWPFDLEAR